MEDSKTTRFMLIAIAAVLSGGIALIVYLVKKHNDKKLKKRILKKIRSVNLKAYDVADRIQIRQLMSRYIQKVKDATDRIDLYAARAAFEDSLSTFKTKAAKLKETKIPKVHVTVD